MIAIFENKYNLDETQINMPFIIGSTPIGVIFEVNEQSFKVNIFDRYVGFELDGLNNPNIVAMYLSEKEQRSYDEVMEDTNNDNVIKL